MGTTKIEWTDAVWNPVTGCTPVSAGCANCYAKRMANRLRGRFGYPADEPFRVTFHPERLDEPLRWRKPRRIFVCSMGDLFHPRVHKTEEAAVFRVMADCPQHTFILLTKRPDEVTVDSSWWRPNIWLGVSVEDQATADERIPVLLQIPAAVRFVSVEPMLEAVNLIYGLRGLVFCHCGEISWPEYPHGERHRGCGMKDNRWSKPQLLDWVICGAETGPGARPMELAWARNLRDQCQAAGVPYFFKRDSSKSRLLDGRMWEEFPG